MIAILIKTFLISSIIFLSILFFIKKNVFKNEPDLGAYASALGVAAMFVAYISLFLTITLW